MQDLIIEAIARSGYLGIFLLMVVENVFPPIPSEVIMGIGGVLVARGQMDFWPLMIVGTLGTTAGNYVWFWIGDKWGYKRLEPFIARHGRWLTLDWEHIEKGSVLRTDDWRSYRKPAKDLDLIHQPENVSKNEKKAHELLPAIHRVFSLVHRVLLTT